MKALLLAAAVGLLVGGCSVAPAPEANHQEHQQHSHPTSSSAPTTIVGKPAQVLSVEQLAATVGCQATITVAVADYRQATCTAAGAPLLILDFTSVDGQRGWLRDSEMYGGVYLVGERWALSGKSREYLQGLQAALGGTVEDPGV